MPLLKAKKIPTLDIVNIYKALADKTRLGIALHLYNAQKECTCSELAMGFKLSQPAFSHHYQKLVMAGVINMRKDGATHYLSLNVENLSLSGINLSAI